MNKFWKSGDLFVWLTGAALMFSLLMIAGLMYLILAKGLGFFWRSDVAELDLQNGSKLMGEIIAQEKVPSKGEGIPDEYRTQLKIGNRDLYGLDFRWVDDEEIESISYPKYAVVLERQEWGNMYGFIKEITENRQVISQGNEASWPVLESLMPVYAKIEAEIKAIEKGDIGGINRQIESYRLKIRGLELKGGDNQAQTQEYESKIKEEEEKYKVEEKKLFVLYKEFNKDKIVMVSVDGREKEMSIGNIVRAFRPNSMNWFQKASLYTSRAWGFVSEYPREANTEGGVFPAIFGTVLMVIPVSYTHLTLPTKRIV